MASDRLFDYEVRDSDGRRIGSVEAVWEDEATGATEFLGVKTGWVLGRIHVVPAKRARIDDDARVVQLPFGEDLVRDAPSFGPQDRIDEAEERRIHAHYRMPVPRTVGPVGEGLEGRTLRSQRHAIHLVHTPQGPELLRGHRPEEEQGKRL